MEEKEANSNNLVTFAKKITLNSWEYANRSRYF